MKRIVGGLVTLAWIALGSLPARAQERLGWSGERMPAGMRKGAKEREYVWGKDQAVMVYVPAGKFRMGDGARDASPVHEVELSAFYIDKLELTWGQWKRSGLAMPSAPDWGIQDDHPVANVSWEDARKFCDWAGRRLPTEAEWEYAARGPEGRIYPWGSEEPTDSHANFWNHLRRTAPVGSYPCGASWCGAMDLAGNVSEWCADWYDTTLYARSRRRTRETTRRR